jgi:hypothetical protein
VSATHAANVLVSPCFFPAGAWNVVDCTAMFPAGGGTVEPRSLLKAPAQQQAESGHAESAPSPHSKGTATGHGSSGASPDKTVNTSGKGTTNVGGSQVKKASWLWWSSNSSSSSGTAGAQELPMEQSKKG